MPNLIPRSTLTAVRETRVGDPWGQRLGHRRKYTAVVGVAKHMSYIHPDNFGAGRYKISNLFIEYLKNDAYTHMVDKVECNDIQGCNII